MEIYKKAHILVFNIHGMGPSPVPSILDVTFDVAIRACLHSAPFCHRALRTCSLGTSQNSLSHKNTDEAIDPLLQVFKYNKEVFMNTLVRDFIPKLIENAGQRPIGYIADEKEYKERLIDKLLEEAKSMEELADVLEVVDAIYETFGFTKEDIQQVQNSKKKEKRGLLGHYILTRVDDETKNLS